MPQSASEQRGPKQIHIQASYLAMGFERNPNVSSCVDPDAALVEALKARTASAFDDLVKRHGQRLLKTAKRITKNVEDAEDVVQETFVKVFKNIDGFRSDSRFVTWLTRITINQALMLIRSKSQKLVSLDESGAPEDKHATPESQVCRYTPEQLCAQREFEDVMLNLKNVRKSSQQVMELRVNHELSDIEIAEALNLSLPAVKARLYRGRMDLRGVISRSFQPAKLARTRMSVPNSVKKVQQRQTRVGASVLASGNPLSARSCQPSSESRSSLTYHLAPQIVTRLRTLRSGGPEIAL
jgi:RNA polymerase sigma-70 factor, ECF subfamily